jgi:UDP-2,3-diacylglucosamine pyrophosphatase LpxH
LKSEYFLKGKQQINLIPVGDIHLGSEQLNYDYLDYWKHTIKNLKGEKRIYLMGDLCESATKRLANSSYRQQLSLDEQIEGTIEFFYPFHKNIVFACMGNHEIRLSKDYDLNIMREISKSLDCKYGNQYIDNFKINNKLISVYVAHGKGSSAYHYTAESKIVRDTQTIQANIIINGHNHRCGHFSIPNRTINGLERKHYVFSGAFLGYGGYADSMQLPLLPEAFLYLGINKERRVFSNVFYIDERRSDLLKLKGVV